MESKIYKFDPVIYPYFLYVAPRFDVDEIRQIFQRVINNKEVCELGDSIEKTLTSIAMSVAVKERKTGNIGYLVLIQRRESADLGIIAHEALHVNSFNNALLGIEPPTYENDEPQAYFIQWVFNCIDSAVDEEVEKTKGILMEDE